MDEETDIIIPPPVVTEIIHKTASFVAKHGRAFEEKISKSGQGTKTKFQFLDPTNPYNAYYEKKIQDIILYGSDEEEIKFSYDDGYETYTTKKPFEGVINNLERRYLETDSEWKREEISQYQSETACEKCKGMRLKDEALCVKINSLNISEVTEKSIDDAQTVSYTHLTLPTKA